MISDRTRVLAYFRDARQAALVREALAPGAAFYPGMAEGDLAVARVPELVAAGLTVERAPRDGPGTEPTPEYAAASAEGIAAPDVAIADVAAEADTTADDEERTDAAAREHKARGIVRSLIGTLVGALLLAAGTLVLLQQLGAADPTLETAVSTLAVAVLVAGIAYGARLLIARGRGARARSGTR